ncbi:hypothetical protein ABW21_db0201668 [Orbilia brochopaga]|nr:hypothetical protein ABW21_db0201668 [Drechslerella brochopaga]
MPQQHGRSGQTEAVPEAPASPYTTLWTEAMEYAARHPHTAGSKGPLSVSERVLFPILAIGLSTPVLSHAICYVGSRLLKRKVNHELNQMIRSVSGNNGSTSRMDSLSVSDATSIYIDTDSISPGHGPSFSVRWKKGRLEAAAKRRREAARKERERRMRKQYRETTRVIVNGDCTSEETEKVSTSSGSSVWRWLEQKKGQFSETMGSLRKGRSRSKPGTISTSSSK